MYHTLQNTVIKSVKKNGPSVLFNPQEDFFYLVAGLRD